MNIRVMTIEDFDQVHALWMSIKGFGIRSVDDSKEGVERFLKTKSYDKRSCRRRRKKSSERFSAGMMEDEAVCIMCV